MGFGISDVCSGYRGRSSSTGERTVRPQRRARPRQVGLLRLQDNPLVHLVSRNGLQQMACARRALQLLSGRYVRELPGPAAQRGASQEMMSDIAELSGTRL